MEVIAYADLFELLSEVLLDPEGDITQRARPLASEMADAGSLSSKLDALDKACRDRRSLSVEYVRLFMHGVGHPTVFPYESVLLHGRLMDPRCLDGLKELFGKADIKPKEAVKMPPDHLGLELEFLSYALRNMAREVTGGSQGGHWRRIVEQLLEEHLIPAAPIFAERLSEVNPPEYYALAAALLTEALAHLSATLKGAGEPAPGTLEGAG